MCRQVHTQGQCHVKLEAEIEVESPRTSQGLSKSPEVGRVAWTDSPFQSSEGSNPADTLTFAFWPPKLWHHQFLWSHSVCGTLLQHFQQTNIDVLYKRFLFPFYTLVGTKGFSGGSDGKESDCNAGDSGSVPGLGRSAGEGNATHSSILAWSISWTEEPGGLQSMGSQRVRHYWATNTQRHTHTLDTKWVFKYALIFFITWDNELWVCCEFICHISSCFLG